MLNFSDKTLKFRAVAMFVIANLQIILHTCLHTNFNMSNCNSSFYIGDRLKANEYFGRTTVFSFHVLQNVAN